MKVVSLKSFIETGKFGDVYLGMHIDDVIDKLGEPESRTDYNNGTAEIIYAYYEFFYSTNTKRLDGIQNDHLAIFPNVKTGRVNNKQDICFSNEKFTIDIWFLKKNRFLTYDEVILNLDKERVSYAVDADFFKNKIIKFESGVIMDFDDLSGLTSFDKDSGEWISATTIEDEGKRILNGIRLFQDKAL